MPEYSLQYLSVADQIERLMVRRQRKLKNRERLEKAQMRYLSGGNVEMAYLSSLAVQITRIQQEINDLDSNIEALLAGEDTGEAVRQKYNQVYISTCYHRFNDAKQFEGSCV